MTDLKTRLDRYSILSKKLEALSDRQLTDLFQNSIENHSGIGGKSGIVTIDDTLVFVKTVPLTDLEKQPEHFMSTINLFGLPLYYQYGVGSNGFGAWRELATHLLTTDWILKGECSNFPVLYHWRILPKSTSQPMTPIQQERLEKDVLYWQNSQAVRNRLQSLHDSSYQLYLCLEYVPLTLYQWLNGKLLKGGEQAEVAVNFVDKKLHETTQFMKSQGLIHFDAHFDNILTDGEMLYLTDFGLALSSKFDLSDKEAEFFNFHQNYDQCCNAVNLLHCIISSYFGRDKWELKLQNYLQGKYESLPKDIDLIIKSYAPVALTMDKFFKQLQKVSKLTPYPLSLDS